jgi:hypothetical protein
MSEASVGLGAKLRPKVAPKITPPPPAPSAPEVKRALRDDGQQLSVPRATIREDMRKNSAAAAAMRAAELRANRSEAPESRDEFDVSHLEAATPGWKYQWNTWSIYEQRDTSNIREMKRRGWEEVPRVEFPEEMPGDSESEVIMRKGMLLMRIPYEIYIEYTERELINARAQVRAKEQSIAGTPDGTLPRDVGGARPKINKDFQPMRVPD